jgi:hypothetical protein
MHKYNNIVELISILLTSIIIIHISNQTCLVVTLILVIFSRTILLLYIKKKFYRKFNKTSSLIILVTIFQSIVYIGLYIKQLFLAIVFIIFSILFSIGLNILTCLD